MPPFGTDSARRHNKKLRGSPRAQRAYAHAAENVYSETHDEGRAIAAGSAAGNASLAKSKRERRRK
jgi:hypothetical protein